MIYAIDFDGTIVENKYPMIGEPNERLINYLKHLKNKGNTLILWTCRVGKELEDAVNYCADLGLTFDYINENTKEHLELYGGDTRKIFADYYIDDKAMDFGYFEKKMPMKKVGELFCGDVYCEKCPLVKCCREIAHYTLYENLEGWYEMYKDDKEIYDILKARLDREVE